MSDKDVSLKEKRQELKRELGNIDSEIAKNKLSKVDWQSVADLIEYLQSKELELKSKPAVSCISKYKFNMHDLVYFNDVSVSVKHNIYDKEDVVRKMQEYEDTFHDVLEKAQELKLKLKAINKIFSYDKINEILVDTYGVNLQRDEIRWL